MNKMGRLENKVKSDKKIVPYFQQVPEDEEEIQEEYYRRKQGMVKRFRDFGFTKDSHAMATEIENRPTPEGKLRMTFAGRPVDLHMLEDYLVWRTSPLAIKTILRYGHAKTMEDVRGYLGTAERARGNPKAMVMIVLAVILLIGGIMFLLYGPQLGALLGFG